MGFLMGKIAEGMNQWVSEHTTEGSKNPAPAQITSSKQSEKLDEIDRFAEGILGKGIGQYAAKALKGAGRFLAKVGNRGQELEPLDPERIQTLLGNTRDQLRLAETSVTDGDFETAYRALTLAQGQVVHLEKGLSKPEKNPQLLVLKARGKLLQGKLADLAGESEKATVYYRDAVKDLNIADENSLLVAPIKSEILGLRSEAKHQMRDYQGALSDRFWQGQGFSLEGRTALRKYEHHLSELADEVEFEAFLAQDRGDPKREALLVAEAVKINQALGREEVAQGLETYLTEVSKNVLPETIQEQAKAQADQGILTPELLSNHPELESWVNLSEAEPGRYILSFSEKFEELELEEKINILESLQKAGVEGTLRHQAATESDPAKRHYYQSKVDLMDGNLEGAKLHLMDLKVAAIASNDEEILGMAAEGREQLRDFALAHLSQMEQFNQSLLDQRSRNGFIKPDNPKEKTYFEMNRRLIGKLRLYIESGHADTLDEALDYLCSQAETDREGLGNPLHAQLMDQFDPKVSQARQLESYVYAAEHPHAFDDFAKGDQMAQKHGDEYFLTLLTLETREELSRRSHPEGRRETLLATADKLRNGWASYEIAGQYYGSLFQEELSSAAEEIPQETVDLIRRRNRNGFDVFKMKEKVQTQLEDLKERDPILYQQRFPDGAPSAKQLDSLVEDAVQAKIDFDLQKEAYRIVNLRYESKDIQDPIVRDAWAKYKDMTDCVDEWGNLSDEAWDQVLQETLVTAITLPATMGAGAAVRGGISASKWAARAASVSRLGSYSVRALTFGAGTLTEGLVMEMQTAALSGDFHAKNVGINMVMSTAFHGGGRLWGRYAERVGVDALAQQAAREEGRAWGARGMKTLDFAGTMGTQTLLGTLLSDPTGSQNLGDNLAANFARNLGSHYGTMTMRGLMPQIMAWEGQGLARQNAARKAYQQAVSTGFTPKASQGFALGQVFPQPARSGRPVRSRPVLEEKSYGFQEFASDTVKGAAFMWRSFEHLVVGTGPNPMAPAYALAAAGRGPVPRHSGRLGDSGFGLMSGLLHVFSTAQPASGPATKVRGGSPQRTGAYAMSERQKTAVLSGDEQRMVRSSRVGEFLCYDKAVERARGQIRSLKETLMGLQFKFRQSNFEVKIKRTPEETLQPDDANFFERPTGDLLRFEIELTPDLNLSTLPKDARQELFMEGLSRESMDLFNSVDEAMRGDLTIDPRVARESLSDQQQKTFDTLTAQIRRAHREQEAETYRRLMEGLNEGDRKFIGETLFLVEKDGVETHRHRYEVAQQTLLPEQKIYFETLEASRDRGNRMSPEEMLNWLREQEGLAPISDWVALRPNQMAKMVAQTINDRGWNQRLGEYEFYVPVDVQGRPVIELSTTSHDAMLKVHIRKQRVKIGKETEYLPVEQEVLVTLTLPRDNVAMFDVRKFGGQPAPRSVSVEELVAAIDAPQPQPKSPSRSVPLDSAESSGPSIFRLDGGNIKKF